MMLPLYSYSPMMNICVLLVFIAALFSTSADEVNTSSSRHLAVLNSEAYNVIEDWLNKRRPQLENSVFVSYDKDGNPYPSLWYEYDDFMLALRSMSISGVGGGELERFFYIGQTDNRGVVHGLVNVAAFLSFASVVSIKYDVCDEFNMDKTDYTDKYAISNACGQYGRSYEDEVCLGNTAYMTCDVDKDIQMTALTSLNEEKAPPKFFCRAKDSATDFTGFWDGATGTLDETLPFSNRLGRIDTAGCCWWGRGVLLTRGTCKFGRVNHFLGAKAAAQGFLNFVDVDFCAYPNIVCEGEDSRNLRWSVGLFEWSDTLQTYQDPASAETYLEALDKFVQGGFSDVNGFIDFVGMAFSFDCFEQSCKAEQARVREERRFVFQNILFNVLALPELMQQDKPAPTPPPTNRIITPDPTQQPTKESVVEIKPPPTPAVIELVDTAPISTQNPTKRPTSTISLNAGPPAINPTLVDTTNELVPTPNDLGLVDLQPGAGANFSISWIAIMFVCVLHCIIL